MEGRPEVIEETRRRGAEARKERWRRRRSVALGLLSTAIAFSIVATPVYFAGSCIINQNSPEYLKAQADAKRQKRLALETENVLGYGASSRSSTGWRIRLPKGERGANWVESNDDGQPRMVEVNSYNYIQFEDEPKRLLVSLPDTGVAVDIFIDSEDDKRLEFDVFLPGPGHNLETWIMPTKLIPNTSSDPIEFIKDQGANPRNKVISILVSRSATPVFDPRLVVQQPSQ